ncbi:hypothetical protein IAR55_002147 [Kwoniella newhampshirensis]|uniref:RNA-binding protein n=1 Tax=Kwoniella newhampshirensis TaxID=1651941 RepID=A0AAW0Z0V0_9TREE
MSYRPRSRSRSPDYRPVRRYSPSRPLSPMRGSGSGGGPPVGPGSRHDDRHLDYGRERYIPPPRPRSRSPPPPPRRYASPPPPPRAYDDTFPPRRPSPPPPRRYDDYPPSSRRYDDPPGGRYPGLEERYIPPPRVREYEDRDRDKDREYQRSRYTEDRPVVGMMSDREDLRAPPRRDLGRNEPQWERGRDVEELASGTYTPPHGSDSLGQSGRRGPRVPAEPSKDVIFLGLDPELTESDFAGFLKTEHQAIFDSVKIVRDKATGLSKGFGFAQFATIDDAAEFINANFPAVLMPALYAHSDPRKVKINFSATQAQSGPYSQAYEQPVISHQPQYVRPGHDGMRDIGPPGGGKRVLLLRGLDSGTTADEVSKRMSQEIARMMGKIGREIAAESTIVRTVLIVDRTARSSWGYGFIELATSELASALLPFLLSPQHQPNGFLINYAPIAASFANPAAFLPTTAGPLGGEFLIRSSRNGGFGSDTIDQPDGKWCAYWHVQGGAQEAVPRGAVVIAEDGTVELTPDHRAFLGVLAGAPALKSATALSDVRPAGMVPINIAGGLQPIKIGGPIKSKKKEEIGIIPLSGKNLLQDDEEEDLVGKDTVLLSRSKGVHIIPPTSSSRKIAKNISKWNTKQSELAAPVAPTEFGAPPKGISDANSALGVRRPIVVAPSTTTASANQSTSSSSSAFASESVTSGTAPAGARIGSGTPPSDIFEYTDLSTLASTGKVACLLCQRQFKTEEILRKHTVQSDLHKTNLLDPTACEAGKKRKAVSLAASVTAEPTQPKYRDRAAERREAFHQPNIPLPEEAPSSSSTGKRKYAEGPKAPLPIPPPPPVVEPGKDESNVGNQLLAKMGWTAGTGLGKEREGRVDPVLVQQFENRAGLGASKGVEAGRWQGPGGFQQRALDMAKERYHSSSEPDKK